MPPEPSSKEKKDRLKPVRILVAVFGFISAVITIVVFVHGKSSLDDYLSTDKKPARKTSDSAVIRSAPPYRPSPNPIPVHDTIKIIPAPKPTMYGDASFDTKPERQVILDPRRSEGQHTTGTIEKIPVASVPLDTAMGRVIIMTLCKFCVFVRIEYDGRTGGDCYWNDTTFNTVWKRDLKPGPHVFKFTDFYGFQSIDTINLEKNKSTIHYFNRHNKFGEGNGRIYFTSGEHLKWKIFLNNTMFNNTTQTLLGRTNSVLAKGTKDEFKRQPYIDLPQGTYHFTADLNPKRNSAIGLSHMERDITIHEGEYKICDLDNSSR